MGKVMTIPAPDFGLEGLEGQELLDRIEEILRAGVAEGDSDTMELLESCIKTKNLCRSIDLFGREEWERGERPAILKSNVSIETRTRQKQPSMLTKILLKLKLAKEVEEIKND